MILCSYDFERLVFVGAAYVYCSDDEGSTWSEVAKLLASDGAAGDLFGITVAIFINTIVVGSYHDNNEKGTNAGLFGLFYFVDNNLCP